jgi:hypothetical protein
MTSHSREFLYWLTTVTVSSPSVVLANIRDITTHEDQVITGATGEHLANFDLRYVYFTKAVDPGRLTTLVADPFYYYVLDNELTDAGSIRSRIYIHECPVKLVELLPEDLRKYMHLKTIKQILAGLSKKDKENLAGILPLDFARASHEQQVKMLTLKFKSENETVNLTGFYTLTPRVIIEAGVRWEQIQTIVMNANEQLNSNLNWLFYFPQLKTLTIWNSEITDAALTNIARYAPNLTIFEVHQCPQITGRCLIELAKMPRLNKIIIDNELCRLQDTTYETVISNEEWGLIKSETIDTLFINSANLTLDFIDFCLKSFRQITNFIMHELVLRKLEKHSRSGHTEHKISFHSAVNLNEGFYRYVDVRITDLVRNKIAPAFSEAMLRKIKERDPSKAEWADRLLGDQN